MTPDEARKILKAFGEGIHPNRQMHTDNPTHDDWHDAVAELTRIPYRGPSHHGEHHLELSAHLDIPIPDTTGPLAGDGRLSHAEHSTLVMRAIAQQTGPRP